MGTELATRELTPGVWGMINAIVETTSGGSKLKQAEIAQKMLFAYENGLPLNLAFNGGLYNVNNRVEVEGNVIRAQIRKHPEYDYEIAELNEKGCTLVITRNGQEIGRASFTEEDAKRAKLLTGKDNWEKYPADMFLNRATSRAYKRFCPDIFFTPVYVYGEVEGEIVEGQIIPNETQLLQELINEYGPDKVLAANNGRMPKNGEVEMVAAALRAQADD